MKYQTNSSVFTHGGGDPAGGHEDADADDEEEEEDGRGHRRRRRARAALAPPPPVGDRRCGRRSHRRAAAPLPRPPLPRLGDESPVFPPGPSDSAPWKRWTGWAVASGIVGRHWIEEASSTGSCWRTLRARRSLRRPRPRGLRREGLSSLVHAGAEFPGHGSGQTESINQSREFFLILALRGC